jgi:hypothetical protein
MGLHIPVTRPNRQRRIRTSLSKQSIQDRIDRDLIQDRFSPVKINVSLTLGQVRLDSTQNRPHIGRQGGLKLNLAA